MIRLLKLKLGLQTLQSKFATGWYKDLPGVATAEEGPEFWRGVYTEWTVKGSFL